MLQETPGRGEVVQEKGGTLPQQVGCAEGAVTKGQKAGMSTHG